MSFSRINKAFLNRVRALTVAIGEADLTAGATSQQIDTPAIPAGSMIMGVDVRVATAFTGGGTTDAKVAVGDADDDDAILASADVDVATAGEWALPAAWLRTVAHRRRGDLTRARRVLDEAGTLSPGDVQLAIAGARADWLQGRIDGVVAVLQHAADH